MKHILAAIDETAASRSVLGAARAFGALLQQPVEAITVSLDTAAKPCALATAIAKAERIPITVCTGHIRPLLLSAGLDDEVSTFVIGSRATAGGRRPLGRTAAASAQGIHKPVLLVPPGFAPQDHFKHVLVCLSHEQHESALFQEMINASARSNAKVSALYVHEQSQLPFFDDQPQHEKIAWDRELQLRYQMGGATSAQVITKAGRSDLTILETINSEEADLLIIGWHEHFSRSLTHAMSMIVSNATIPVLLVPNDVPTSNLHPSIKTAVV